MNTPRKDVLANIAEAEKKGEYNSHVEPFDVNDSYPVTKDYPYIKHGWTKIKNDLINQFIVKPFTKKECEKTQHIRVFGRENIKGIDAAIVTCNHVYMFDCLSVKYALKGKDVKISAAYFNNLKGSLGDLMRAGGMLPINMTDLKALRKFEEAVDYYLKRKKYILFYPEQGMWWNYKKPRSLKNGAYHYAIKHNVPLIPLFITFRDSSLFDSEGLKIEYTDIHILNPIYLKPELSEKENIEYMRKLNHSMVVDLYEKTYHEKYKLDNYTGEF